LGKFQTSKIQLYNWIERVHAVNDHQSIHYVYYASTRTSHSDSAPTKEPTQRFLVVITGGVYKSLVFTSANLPQVD
jgi:hypothetical protein